MAKYRITGFVVRKTPIGFVVTAENENEALAIANESINTPNVEWAEIDAERDDDHREGCDSDTPHCKRCGWCEIDGDQCICYAR